MAMPLPLILIAALNLAIGPCPAGETSAPPTDQTIPNTTWALPPGLELSVEWVITPAPAAKKTDKQTAGNKWDEMRFDVDAKGIPWFGNGKRKLMVNPLKNSLFLLSEPFLDFAWLQSGQLIILTNTTLGFLDNSREPVTGASGLPIMPFKPGMGMPYAGMRLTVAGNQALYIQGQNPRDKQYEVYLLKAAEGEKGPRAVTLFASEEAVTATAGDGGSLFVAVGRLVVRVRVEKEKGNMVGVFAHPTQEITGLAFSKEAGLFYATASAIGYVGEDNYEFMKSPKTRISLHGKELYVFLGAGNGVIKISDVDQFSKLRSQQ